MPLTWVHQPIALYRQQVETEGYFTSGPEPTYTVIRTQMLGRDITPQFWWGCEDFQKANGVLVPQTVCNSYKDGMLRCQEHFNEMQQP